MLAMLMGAFGATRGLAIAAALATGLLAWLAHRGLARAGADTSTTEGASGTSTTGGSTVASPDSTAADATASTASSDSTTANESFETGPCLTAPLTTGNDTEPEPEVLPCLCACETGHDGEAIDWAPALLLPVLARRRRSRRRSLEQLAAAGRLPEDVVARLRRRLANDERDRLEWTNRSGR